MNSTFTPYNIIKQIKDDKFNVEHLQHYNLSLQVGYSEFQIAVIDIRNQRCLIMESYELHRDTDLHAALVSIFEDHHFLKAGFWNSVKVAFKNNKFSLVPYSLFDRENLREYLTINVQSEDDSLFYYKHEKLKAVNVFAASSEIVSFFNGSYPGTTLHFLHQESVLIEGISKYEDFSFNRNMSLLMERNAVNVLVHEEQKLIYCNRFNFFSPQKLMQYIMTVMHELNLDQYETRTIVWGDIQASSETFEVLQKYIYNISFGGKLPLLQFGYVFDEIEDHNFFDLFSIYFCD